MNFCFVFLEFIVAKKPLLGKSLTMGSIMRGSNNDTTGNPVLQVLDIKKLSSDPLRFRVILSDGLHFQQALFAQHLNIMISSNQVKVMCIIQLHDFKCYSFRSEIGLQEKLVFFIEKLIVLDNSLCKEVIGNPVVYNNSVSSK